MEAESRGHGARNSLIGLAFFIPGVVLFTFARAWLLKTFGTVESDQSSVSIRR